MHQTIEDAPIRPFLALENAPPPDILVLPAWVAQLVEQWIENPCVGGSIPSPGTSNHALLAPATNRGFLLLRHFGATLAPYA